MIEADLSALLLALEKSGFAAALRQSPWVYPAANTGHILALAVFAAAVAIMDLRLMGFPAATRPGDVVLPARRVAIGALLVQAATGFLLFAPEASKLALNSAFLAKLAFIATGLANALVLGRLSRKTMEAIPAGAPLPFRLRVAGAASLAIWFSVAALGRLIAYV